MRLPRAALVAVPAWLVVATPVAAAPSTAPLAAISPAVRIALERHARAVEDSKAAMMGDPEAALRHARAAAEVTQALPAGKRRALSQAEARWLEGEALARLNRTEEAAPIVEGALALAVHHQPGSKLEGDLLRARAGIALDRGQVRQALESYERAHRIFHRLGEARSRSLTLVDIGAIYGEARDHARALRYYDGAAEAYADDPSIMLVVQNGRATELKELGELPRAEAAYRTALDLARDLGSPWLAARILANLASVQLLRGDPALADMTAIAGLRAAAGAPELTPPLWGVRAQAAFERGETGRAAQMITRTFEGVELETSSLEFRDFHAAAERIYAAAGRPELALAHLRALKRLDDEASAAVASTSAALVGARFDFASQNLRIAELKAGQLQRDIMLTRSRERLQRAMLIASVGIGLALLVGGTVALMSIRRSRDSVRAVNQDLTRLNAELEKALKAKGEFLATTSHEIRTPLNGILGMTQLMLDDPELAPAQRERVGLVHGAGETMRALVDDLLDMAKIEHGKLTIEMGEVEIRRVLREGGQLWCGQAAAKGLALEIDVDQAPESIVGDERHLRQIVFNLMSNAIKFTERGCVRLEAATKVLDGGEQLVVRVRDTGIGVVPDQLALIFEPFHQVDGGTTRQFSGTGLGLAICRNIARALGGDVVVESQPGEGSTFTLTVPYERTRQDSRRPGEPVTQADQPALSDTRLLIVEPNPLRRSILTALFESDFARVEAVGSTADAEAARAPPFDYLLLDLEGLAPGPDSAMDWLALHARHGTCVVALAPGAEAQTVASLERHGACIVHTAPFDLVGLRSLLSAVHERCAGRCIRATAPLGEAA